MVCACKNFADGGRPMTRIVVGLIAWAPYFHCWIWMRCAPGAAPHNVCWMGLDSAGCSSSAAPPLITTPLSILMFASMRALPAASCCKSLWVRNLPMARRSLRELWDSFSKARNNLRLADYRFCPRQHQIQENWHFAMHPTQTKNIFLLNTVAPFRCQNRRRAHFMFNGCRSTYPWVMVDQPGQRAARIHIISWRLFDPWAVGHMRLVDLQRGCFGLKMLQRWSQFLNALGDFLHGWASRCARQVLFLFACFLSSLIEVDLGFDSNVLRGRDPLLQVILVLHKLLGKLLPIAHGFGEKSFPCLEVSGSNTALVPAWSA